MMTDFAAQVLGRKLHSFSPEQDLLTAAGFQRLTCFQAKL